MSEQESAPPQQATIVRMSPSEELAVRKGRTPVFGLCGLAMFLLMLAEMLFLYRPIRLHCTGVSCLEAAAMAWLIIAVTAFIGTCLNVTGLFRRERTPLYVMVALAGNALLATDFLMFLFNYGVAWMNHPA